MSTNLDKLVEFCNAYPDLAAELTALRKVAEAAERVDAATDTTDMRTFKTMLGQLRSALAERRAVAQ